MLFLTQIWKIKEFYCGKENRVLVWKEKRKNIDHIVLESFPYTLVLPQVKQKYNLVGSYICRKGLAMHLGKKICNAIRSLKIVNKHTQ